MITWNLDPRCSISGIALLVLACALPCSAAGAAEKHGRLPDAPPLPILAWGGPPQDQTTPERYKELADAGFTHNYSGFGGVEAMQKALDVAHAAGVKQFLSLPQLQSDPEATARRFKDHPALAGYYLRDEPSAADFEALAKWARRIQSADADHPCYINLFPTYATPDQLGAANYASYVERFLKEVPVPVLSFDHYPVIGADALRPDWYQNLEIISSAARGAGKPFWAFALSVAHAPYPVPTPAHLRVQVYSNLAYGAQGIQYFTYWTSKSDTWDFHEGPIDPSGKRTQTYERVRAMNREVQALRGVFVGSSVVSVGHAGKSIPSGTRAYAPAAPVRTLETDGQGAVVSLLEKERRRFLVVVNRDVVKAMKVAVTLDPAAGARRVAGDGTYEALTGATLRREVGPGDVAVITWERP